MTLWMEEILQLSEIPGKNSSINNVCSIISFLAGGFNSFENY